jgi:hypothetical protein
MIGQVESSCECGNDPSGCGVAAKTMASRSVQLHVVSLLVRFKYNVLSYYDFVVSSVGLFSVTCRVFYGLSTNDFEGESLYALGLS